VRLLSTVFVSKVYFRKHEKAAQTTESGDEKREKPKPEEWQATASALPTIHFQFVHPLFMLKISFFIPVGGNIYASLASISRFEDPSFVSLHRHSLRLISEPAIVN
jgi:ABC-type Fe3+ transport system permease subunit